MKIILGLDLGTNSIGWALIEQDFDNKLGKIRGMGSRIIPMSQKELGNFANGITETKASERTKLRITRRLLERYLLRRERLHRVLHILGFLPQHYASKIDFDVRYGKFLPETETKYAYDAAGNFIFESSFEEMLAEMKAAQPELMASGKKVSYDWTIYYLRKKGLTKRLTNEELGWLLLHFNQKRGYYQTRGEDDDETSNKIEEYHSLKVMQVTADPPVKGKNEVWYSMLLENGWVYRRASKQPLMDWEGKVRDFIVTTELDSEGQPKLGKDGAVKRSFRAPQEGDWKLQKKKTESEIELSKLTVGEYIYNSLLRNPDKKIRGGLVRTIERKYYVDELMRILNMQCALNPVLLDEQKYRECIEELYPHNVNHRNLLSNKDFVHFFVADIIFYQRPLKSKKGTVSNCPLEHRVYVHEGVKKTEPLKCVSKSHPTYQEYRLWKWINDLRILRRDDDADVTTDVLGDVTQVSALYAQLCHLEVVNQKTLLKALKLSEKTHRWNYVEDKDYPCCETASMIASRLAKVGDGQKVLNEDELLQLWHIIYSVTDKKEYEQALKKYAARVGVDEDSFYEHFRKFPPFESTYGAYSLKAIKKLLPLMKAGNYWDYDEVDAATKNRIEKLLHAEYDEQIRDRVREKAILLKEGKDFNYLPEWLAKYIVYDRHSEQGTATSWSSVAELDDYIASIKHHSLRNPIVEQVYLEALRVVRDVWEHYGDGQANYIDEIHVELGRELKKTNDERARITKTVTENENTNLRIKALLAELLQDPQCDDVRPYSPMQQEILKIYEEGVLSSGVELPDDVAKISKLAQPQAAELKRYRLWLDQKYRSPYTGELIPLNKLFGPAYEIEHVLPQSRYYDDSLSNKVICEAAVNKLKDNRTAMEFIKNEHGRVVELGMGKKVKIMEVAAYEEHVKTVYAQNRNKKAKLLMEDVPEQMIARQLNDTRYISKLVMGALSNVVRAKTKDDGANSKNVLACNGQITTKLRNDWGLDALWNELILPRFERLNELTGTKDYTTYNERYQKYLPTVPLALQKGFSKKRIDHRHHALDALVIACATRSHINYLNNQHALEKHKSKEQRQSDRYDLKVKLCDKKQSGANGEKEWSFKQPWPTIVVDARERMSNMIVSYKQKLRVINKTTNRYIVKDADGKTVVKKQEKGDRIAIRKPLHKDTVYGAVTLVKIKDVALSGALDEPTKIVDKTLRKYVLEGLAGGKDKKTLLKQIKDAGNIVDGKIVEKVGVYYNDTEQIATRKSIDVNIDKTKIESVTDSGIKKVLLRYLDLKGGDPEVAFSPEGLEDMNSRIAELNDGKQRKPIYKARFSEAKGKKYCVGETGNKIYKYVEAAQDTNLFFAVYEDAQKKRSFETVPLNEAIERLKQGVSPVPKINMKENKLLFYLSPNDTIYIPFDNEDINQLDFRNLTAKQSQRIWIVNDFSSAIYFGPNYFAHAIVKKELDMSFDYKTGKIKGSFDSKTASIDGIQIKDICIKVRVDRLGRIIKY